MTHDEMTSVTAEASTISERIRLLHDAGVSASEIASFVGRRYQHVYNVLKDYKRRQAGGLVAGPAVAEVISLELGRDGTLRLPPEWIETEGLSAGDIIICRTETRGLLIMSRAAATEALRDLTRKHMPTEAALLDALLGGTTE